MSAYYNEIDPFAAAWLRNLIAAGHIARGEVDTRSIEDVSPDDLRSFRQCHFFAGIGVWSLALRSAGWTDDRPAWTGSCPCQPFSGAGKRGGTADERHLWPAWFHLIQECRPPVVLGEQVASKDGLGWFDLVSADLEGSSYAVAAADMCAAGVGAPHIRQRLWFVGVGDPLRTGLEGHGRHGDSAAGREVSSGPVAKAGTNGRVADTAGSGRGEERSHIGGPAVGDCEEGFASRPRGGDIRPGPTGGFWRDADWLLCRDGKWRPVESGTSPLADGTSGRVGRLRAYGNAIVAPVASTFIEAVIDCLP